jgi:hypothetical protein
MSFVELEMEMNNPKKIHVPVVQSKFTRWQYEISNDLHGDNMAIS